MKKIVAYIFIYLSLFLPAYSYVLFEAGSGICYVAMDQYNAEVDATNNENELNGYVSNLQKLDFSYSPELNLGLFFDTGLGLIAPYMKNSAVINFGNGGNVTWPDGANASVTERNFSVIYTGIGVRRYFIQDTSSALNAFIGVDAGFYYSFWNNLNVTTYNYDGSELNYINKKWSAFIPGINIEAGANWKLSDSLELNIKAGYKFGQGTVIVDTASDLSEYNGVRLRSAIDYSGVYIMAGTALNMDSIFGEKDRYMINMDLPYASLAVQFYKDGVSFFNNGNYDESEIKFQSALRIDPDSSQIKEYLRKIQMARQALLSSGSIEKNLETADGLRNEGNYSAAYKKYAEVLKTDPGNQAAGFFMEDFKKKAAVLKETSEKAKASGKYSKALKDAKLASEYSPDDISIAALRDELAALIENKKNADSLFNLGVESYQKGDYSKAIDLWEQVLEKTPGDKETEKNIKSALEKLDNAKKEGENSIEKILAEASDLLSKGILDKARNKCELALRLEPANKEALKMMEKITALEKPVETGNSVIKR